MFMSICQIPLKCLLVILGQLDFPLDWLSIMFCLCLIFILT
ncbi:hypothetical protein LINPERHAP1_LOCUS13404 [Linum perenne]